MKVKKSLDLVGQLGSRINAYGPSARIVLPIHFEQKQFASIYFVLSHALNRYTLKERVQLH